jgi:hypothetical protein
MYTKDEVKALMLQFAKENMPQPEPPQLTRRERRRMRKLESLRSQLEALKEPPEEAKYIVSPEEASRLQLEEDGKKFVQMQQSHFKGKKKLQFAPASEPVEPEGGQAPTPQTAVPDVIEEQVVRTMTTIYCPESVPEEALKEVRRIPELYIEINVIKQSRVVDGFYIRGELKSFHYKKKEYRVKEDAIYLLPQKSGMFIPTCFYRENDTNPRGFKQMNKGITGKAMSLLYMEQLYTSLLYSEDTKYNFFIVILSIGILIAYGIGVYLTFFHNGGIMPKPPAPVIETILMPWRLLI